MAQKVLVEMVDDIDGSVASQTVPFGIDGVQYEIDLSEENAIGLRDEFSRYITASRRVGGRKVRSVMGTTVPSTHDRERSREIRAWAVANGWDVSERGRIPATVITAFEERDQALTKAPRRRGSKKA